MTNSGTTAAGFVNVSTLRTSDSCTPWDYQWRYLSPLLDIVVVEYGLLNSQSLHQAMLPNATTTPRYVSSPIVLEKDTHGRQISQDIEKSRHDQSRGKELALPTGCAAEE